MSNLSTIDDMPNITANFSDDTYHHDETPYDKIFLELFTVVGLLSVTANILLIFVILKYKKMRKDVTNRIFLQINILQAVYLLATPLTFRVAMAFLDLSPVHLVVFCVSYQIEIILMFAVTWFMFLLVCDWLLKMYCKETYMKFCRVYKFFVIALYVLTVFVCSITTQLCFRNTMVLVTYIVLVGCVGLTGLFIIILNIVHVIKKKRVQINYRKGHIGLAIANICFLLWSPAFVFSVLSSVYFIYAPLVLIFLLSLGFSSPIFNLAYLFFFDDNYSAFLKQVFTCKCNEYRNESLEDQSVIYNDVSGVQIPEK